jgi:hypothetical protein
MPRIDFTVCICVTCIMLNKNKNHYRNKWMCVLTLRIIFACLSKAWFDPERVSRAIGLFTTTVESQLCLSSRGQLATEVVSGRLHPLPLGRFLVPISDRGWVGPRAIVRLEGLGHLKNAMTSSGIDPAACSIVPQPIKLPRASVTIRMCAVPNFYMQ